MACTLLFGEAVMNAHFFAAKRAYYAIVRVTRKPLASLGLTAARFDMMYALFGRALAYPSTRYAGTQSELRRELGVCKSVVSRMVASLEKLGLLTRRRLPFGDQRQRHLELTKAGLECIAAAHQALKCASKRLLCMAICFGKDRDPDERFLRMCELESYLNAIRTCYGDPARLVYPWHPDD
jgi:DNA-binding MarR family transcriptional regulator